MMPFKKLAPGYAFCGSLIALLVILVAMAGSPAHAAVLSASASPSSVGVASNGPSTVTINWQLMITVPAGTTTFSSANGSLTAGATSLGTYGGALSRTLPFSAPTTRTLTITETLTINRALARRIAQEGGVVFSRSFTDGAGSAVAAVTLVPTGTSADLSLQNLELRFDDDAQYRIVGQKDSLTARALIGYSGNGVLRGRWEIADPVSVSIGEPRFRILREVRQTLVGAGSMPLVSPPLPTQVQGVHIVRFVVNEPAIGANVAIRYVVSAPDSLARIELMSPAPGEALTPESVFLWRPVAGAAVYHLEFFEAQLGRIALQTQPLAGVEVKQSDIATRLKPFILDKLRDRGQISWRVVAYDEDGALVAASPFRDLAN